MKAIPVLICLLFYFGSCNSESLLFHVNQWAVHVPNGISYAKAIARLRGLYFEFQIHGLSNIFIVSDLKTPKRHEKPSHHVTKKLLYHPHVVWVEQQAARKRFKRDNGLPKSDNFSDVLWDKEWYLRKGAVGNFDMNVQEAWKLGYTGKGLVVSILDDGIDYTHPDLSSNYDAEASSDINNHDNDPMPRSTFNNENKHGTRCAGEVSAQADNMVCNVGVAHNARIGGVRMLDGDITDAVEGSSLALNQQHIDIYSASWGPDDDGHTVDGPGPLAQQAFLKGVTEGRRGLGNIFVWASGNGGLQHDSCAADGYTNSLYTLSVSSVSQTNRVPWYLEECASTMATTYSSGGNTEPQIATTDLHQQCTTQHTGTSASAPIAAGIVALTLEANGNLTWRDIQHLVVLTANPKPFVQPEWIVNGDGRQVSLRFGFGLMNAGLMVQLARVWRTVPPLHTCRLARQSFNKEFENNKPIMVELRVEHAECQQKEEVVAWLEKVQLFLDIDYSRRGGLQMVLESPAGTKSTMLPRRMYDSHSGSTTFHKWPLMSVQFWRERPGRGVWRLHIQGEAGQSGLLKWAQLVLFGTAQTPVQLKTPRQRPLPYWWSQFAALAEVPSTNKRNRSGTSNQHYNASRLLCHELCRKEAGCHGRDPDDCHKCLVVRALNSNLCLARCPVAQFPAQSDGELRCAACHSSCSSCQSAGPHKCLTCSSTQFLLDGMCLAQCPRSYFATNGKCVPCALECEDCTGSTEALCQRCREPLRLVNNRCMDPGSLRCQSNQYVDRDSASCLPCHSSCMICNGAGKSNCLRCVTNLFLIKDQGCMSTCPAGFFGSDGRCVQCHPSCATCYGALSSQCSTCPTSLVLNQGRCTSNCPVGKYRSAVDENCLTCDSTCETCSANGPNKCLSCTLGYFLWQGTCIAKSIGCPMSTFMSVSRRVCDLCHFSCAACDAGGHQNCTSCPSTLRLDEKHQCVTPNVCSLGRFGQQCATCHARCRSCNGPSHTHCTSCHRVQNQCLHQGQCVDCCSDSSIGNCASCELGKVRCGSVALLAASLRDSFHQNQTIPANSLALTAVLFCAALIGITLAIFAMLQARSQRRFCWTRPYRPMQTVYDKSGASVSLLNSDGMDDEDDDEEKGQFNGRNYSLVKESTNSLLS